MEHDLRQHQSDLEHAQDKKDRAKKNAETKEARRRRKLERQEQKVERLNEPLTVWLCRTFRVVTILATIIMTLLEVHNSLAFGAENIMQRVWFTALGAWTAFGSVWLISAGIRIISITKQNDYDEEEYMKYRRNILGAFSGFAFLLVCYLAVM